MREVNTTLDDVGFSDIVTIRNKLMKNSKSLRLESGMPDFKTHPLIKEAMKRAIDDDKTFYAPSSGYPQLREALYQKLTRENGIHLNSPGDVIVTDGGVGAISYALKTIINPHTYDEVIIPDPNWGQTRDLILYNNGIPVPVKLDERTFRLDPIRVEERITSKTKAIILNTPHNPTGSIASSDDLAEIVSIAERYGVYIISDEPYEDIIYEGEHVSPASLSHYEGIITAGTASKSYSMTGLRIGWAAAANKKIMGNLEKAVLDTCNGVSAPTQFGFLAALTNPNEINPWIQEMVSIYRERRDLLMEGINASTHFQCESPKGAFYIFPRIINYDGSDADVATRLLENDPPIGSVPGSSFGKAGKGHIRFAYSTNTESVRKAAHILRYFRM